MPEWVRVPLVLLVWSIWLPGRFLFHLCRTAWRIFGASRPRRAASLAVLALLLLGLIKAVPLVYGRYALIYEAAHLARTALVRSDATIQENLVRTAFRHGYTDVIEQAEAFRVEKTYDEDGMPMCGISIDLRQRVSCLGLFAVPVRIRTRVVKPMDPGAIKPQPWEERLFGE